ncbi:MAG: hypothetical protein ACFFBD_23660, partial [Candidatus Hodarchaeota archaeon]
NINTSIYKLESSLDKLRRNSIGLKRRDKKFFDICIQAQMNSDFRRAVLYANECAAIRKMAKIILSSELALEQAIVRLHTISELSDVVGALSPIVEIVQETKSRISGIIPSVAGKLEDVTNILHTSLGEIGSVNKVSSVIKAPEYEAKTILQEANHAAEERIRDKFPQIPQDVTIAKESELQIPIVLTATGSTSLSPGSTSLKNEVYNYIKTHDGKLSVIQCASFFHVSPTEIEKAILILKDEGKITLE